MKRHIILWLSLLGLPLLLPGQDQNCGLESQWRLLPNTTAEFPLEVNGYANGQLNNAGQGVCRIELGIVHNAFKDLELWLVSPAGQELQLIGPNVPGSTTTLLANWNIAFVRSSEIAAPLPGFSARWTNDQAISFTINGTGTYFPFNGNLEDFNAGPVNGIWRVRVRTDPTFVLLNSLIYHFRIVFCDEAGTACCFAEAGAMRNVSDLTVCPGDPALALQPEPNYTFAIRPDTLLYGYTYVISENDTVQGLTDDPDLTAFLPGNYQVCGLSYLRTDQTKLTGIPVGAITVDSLRRNLDSGLPLFCGDMTDQCVTIRIVDPVAVIAPTEPLTCTRTAVTLDGRASTPAGAITYEWRDAAGNLLGSAATQPVSSPGAYQLIVTLNGGSCRVSQTVEVREEKTTPPALGGPGGTLTCAAAELTLGDGNVPPDPNYTYSWTTTGGRFTTATTLARPRVDAPGLYRLRVTDTRNGCFTDDEVTVTQDTTAPPANAGPGAVLTCLVTELTLGDAALPPDPDFTYAWSTTGGRFTTAATIARPRVDAPGVYRLRVTDTRNGCTADSEVTITQNITTPIAAAGPDTVLTCAAPRLTLGGAATSTGPEYSYAWTTTGGRFTTATTIARPAVDQPGVYRLRVTDARNGCRADDEVVVTQNTATPGADAGPAQVLTCRAPVATLGGPGTATGPAFTYQWTTTGGRFVTAATVARPQVDAAGTYSLRVTDTRNGCTSTSTAAVAVDKDIPDANPGSPRTLTCAQPGLRLDGSASTGGLNYQWRALDGGAPPADANTLAPLVSRPGTYELLVVDPVSGCRDSASVEVLIDTLAPRVAIAIPARLNCERTGVSLDARASDQGAGVSFVWRAFDGGILSAGANTLTPTAAATGRYELLITNTATGCRDSASVIVRDTINTPQALVAPGGTLTCAQPRLPLDGSASSTGTDIVYRWSTTDGRIDGAADAAIATASAPGTYRLLVRDTVTGCESVATVSVAADTSFPVADAGGAQALTCTVNQVTLDGGASTPGGTLRYRWSGPCLSSAADAVAVTADCAGTYYLTVERTDNGCTAVDSVVVRVDTIAPAAEAGLSDTLTCLAPERTLDGRGSTQGPALSYQWTGPAIVSGAATLQPTVAGPGVYTLEVTDNGNGCRSRDSVTVARDTLAPRSDAGPDRVIDCNNVSVELGGPNSSSGPAFSYRWLATSGVITGPDTGPTLRTAFPGIYILRVTDRGNGCSHEDQVAVRLDRDPPRTDAGPDRELNCSTPRVLLNGSNSAPDADTRLQWSGPCLPPGPAGLVVEVDCPGVYYLTLTNTRTGCVGLDSVLVTRSELGPRAVLADTSDISCETGSVRLDGSRSAGGRFAWWRDGRLLAGDAPSLEVRQPGRYQLIITDTDLGCADTATALVRLNCTPLATIASPDTITCRQEIIVLDATASSRGGAMSYRWTAPRAGCLVEGAAGLEPRVNCGGVYTLIVTNTAVQMSDTATVTVVIDTVAPVAVTNPPDTLTCTRPAVTLDATGTSAGPGYRYYWSNFAGDTLGADLTATARRPGAYVFEVVDQRNGCRDVGFSVVQQDGSLPQLDFGNDVFPCQQDTFRLDVAVTPTPANYRYAWSGPGIVADADRAAVLIRAAGRYTLTVTNLDNGCSTTDSVMVAQQVCGPCVDILPPSDTITCVTEAVRLEARLCDTCTACRVEWSTTDGRLLDGANTLTPLAGAPGVYTLTVTDTLGFATQVRTTVFAAIDPPPADAGPDRRLTCSELELRLGQPDASGLRQYRWERLDGVPVDSAEQALLVVRRPGQYRLEVTDRRTGCRAADTVVVTLDTLPPLADAGPGRELTCRDPRVTLDGGGSTIGANVSYRWRAAPGGNILTGEASLTPLVDRAGAYRLTVTNLINGCTAVDSVVVTNGSDLPAVPDIPDGVLTCASPALTLTGATPDANNYDARWCVLDGAGNAVDCSDGLRRPVDRPGRYRFEVVDRRSGCRNSDLVTVTENRAAPTVDAGPGRELGCGDAGVVLQGSAGPPGARLRYRWSGPAGVLIEGETMPAARVFGAGNFYLRVISETSGCEAIDSVVVTRDAAAPSISIAPPDTLTCQRTQTALVATVTASPGSTLVFQWDTAEGRIIGGADGAAARVDRPGIYELAVADRVTGCTSIAMVRVPQDTVQPEAVVENSGNLALTCRSSLLRLDGGASRSVSGAPLEFNWRATGDNAIIGNPFTPSVQVAGPGRYLLIVTEPRNGCRDTLTIDVLDNRTPPNVTIAPPGVITCDVPAVTLNGSTNASRPSFAWRDAAGDIIAENTPTLTVRRRGTYQLFVEDGATGCTNRAAVTVEVDTLPPVARILPPAGLDCDQPTVTLDGSASSSGGDFRYSWSSADGRIVEGRQSRIAVVDAPGRYTLLVENLRTGCIASAGVDVEQTGQAIASVTLTVTPPTCDGDGTGAIRIDEVEGGAGPYLYALNDNRLSSPAAFTQLLPGQYRVRVQDSNGCEWEGLATIPELETITVDLGNDIAIPLGDTAVLTATVNGPYDRLVWLPESLFPDQGKPDQAVAPLETTIYSVMVEARGCRAYDQITVTVTKLRELFAPTAFSPNGDGVNDRFVLYGGQDVKQVRYLKIFDRWGNLVWQTGAFAPNDLTAGWDGTLNGRPLNPAVFVYLAEVEYLDGWVEMRSGDVALVK